MSLSSSSQNNSQDATEFVRNATFSQGSATAPLETVTASDLLLGAYDPAKLHPMSGLSDKLDYLMLDDDKVSELPGSGTAIPSRGWSDDLCYGTGTMYLSGTFLFRTSPHLHHHQNPCQKRPPFFCSLPHLIINLIVLVLITCSLLFHRPGSWRSMGLA